MKLFTKNGKIVRLAMLGGLLLIVSALIFFNDPLQLIIDWQLTLAGGTLLYSLWLEPPLEVFLTVYIFNITNLEAFTRGVDSKLRVEEIGPYVYQEILTNHNVSFNANHTITYTPRRRVLFRRDRSVGDPAVDRIIAPNIPYMGITSAATRYSAFAAIAVNALTQRLNSKTVLEMTVQEYLWGYDDPLVHLASRFLPNVIKFKDFGLLARMFDEGDNVITMKLPEKKKPEAPENSEAVKLKDFSIDNWNGAQGLKPWDYKDGQNNTACNTLRGAYDGTLFPRKINPGDTFRVYRKAFCRTLPLVYSHPGVFDGIEGYNFKMRADAFDSDIHDPESACYCKGNQCLKRGLGSIIPCYYNIPLAISFPHFLNADPSLHESVDGLHPDEEKHGSEIIIQPQMGIPMIVHSRFQANMLMYDIKYNKEMSRFSNTVLPLLWMEVSIDSLTPGIVFLLKFLFNFCPYAQLVAVIALVLGGLYCVVGALLLCFWMPAPWHPFKVTLEQTACHMEAAMKATTVCIMPLLKQPSKEQRPKGRGKACDESSLIPPQQQSLPFKKPLSMV